MNRMARDPLAAPNVYAQHGPKAGGERVDGGANARPMTHAQRQAGRDYWRRQQEKLEIEQAPVVCVQSLSC